MNINIKKGVAYILTAVLALSVSACGNGNSSSDRKSSKNSAKNDTSISQDDNSGGGFFDDNNNNSDNGGNYGGDSSVNTLPTEILNADVDFKIYKIGNDSFVAVIRSDLCKTMGDSTVWNSYGEKEFYFQTDDGSYCQLQHNNSNFVIKTGGTEYSAWTNSSWGTTFSGSDVYFTRINEKDFIGKLNPDQNYVLTYKDFSSGTADGQRVKEGKVSDILLDMTEEEYDKLSDETFSKGIAPKEAEAPWEGQYLQENNYYNDDAKTGSVSISKTEGGLLKIDIDIAETQKTIYAVEREYDAANYAYGSIINAKAEGLNVSMNNGACEFNYKLDENGKETLEVNYSVYGGDNSFYCQATLKRFKLWRQADAGYVDKDPTGGEIDAIDVKNDPYFTAKTDDYSIHYDPNTTVYSKKDFNVKRAILQSYDKNKIRVQRVTRYEFASESEANEYYTERSRYLEDDETMNISGKYVYEGESTWETFKEVKLGAIAGSAWRVGIHYFEGAYSGANVYISKPITKDDYDVSFEDAMFWKNIGGSHCDSIEPDIGTLYISIDAEYRILRFYAVPVGDVRTIEDDPVIFTGRHAISAGRAYGYIDGSQTYFLNIIEFELNGNIMTATSYLFKGDDTGALDDEINLSNFKEKEAYNITTATFDLTTAQ